MKGDLIIMKRFLAVFLMLAILLTGLTVTANAETGWVKKDGNWYYYKADGTLLTSDWVQSKGKWYYLGADGVMYYDGIWEIKDKFYGFDADGAMAVGWYSRKWNSVKWDGTPFVGTSWYYADKDGALVSGWKQIGGKWYYFAKPEVESWVDEDGETYTYKTWPEMYASNVYEINGKYYAFKGSGEMIVGWGQPWLEYPWAPASETEWLTDWVYANADGSLDSGWKKIDGKWYYFYKGEPYMIRNRVVPLKGNDFDWESEKPTVYGFAQSGAMIENAWFRESHNYLGTVTYGPWYYFGKDGAAKKGWFQDKGKWYYLNDNTGAMETGWITMSDGNKYYLDPTTGAMKTGWFQEGENWFYFKDSGAMVKSDWVKSSGKWYYLKDTGIMAKSEKLVIGGKEYTFGADGAMQ